MDKINACAAILIGGKSLRFGKDKAYMTFEDDPVSIHIYRIPDKIFPEVFFISGTGNSDVTVPVWNGLIEPFFAFYHRR